MAQTLCSTYGSWWSNTTRKSLSVHEGKHSQEYLLSVQGNKFLASGRTKVKSSRQSRPCRSQSGYFVIGSGKKLKTEQLHSFIWWTRWQSTKQVLKLYALYAVSFNSSSGNRHCLYSGDISLTSGSLLIACMNIWKILSWPGLLASTL